MLEPNLPHRLHTSRFDPADVEVLEGEDRVEGFLDEQFQDSSNTTRLPSHTVFDLYLSHPVGPRVEVYGTAENLFDEEYTADAFGGLNHRAAPRQISGGVRMRFD